MTTVLTTYPNISGSGHQLKITGRKFLDIFGQLSKLALPNVGAGNMG